MNSLIMRTATRLLLPLLMIYSVFLLLRGHNEPGGGFVGGLVAAVAITLYALAYDVHAARRVSWADPQTMIGVGLALALLAGVVGLLAGLPFLTGLWTVFEVPGVGKLGTPLLFDFGVYLLVSGISMLIVFSVAEA